MGIGSSSQLVSGESDSSLKILSMVTGAKEEKCGGVTGWEMWESEHDWGEDWCVICESYQRKR